MKRNLTPEEISDICSVVKPSPFLSPDVIECITDNLTNNIKRQLKSIQIYPQNIPKLKEQIELYYERSRIDPSESVGCIAASSIGADTTQASLNSVEWNTRVIIDKDGKTVDDTIGNLIDTEFKLKGYTTVVYSGQIDENIQNGNNPYAQVLDTNDKEWFIPSVDKHGNTSWKKITQLIRHPLYTGLIKVTTSNGRTVTATTGLSFLTKKGDEIVPTLGSDLKVGDELPIAWKIPRPNVIQTMYNGNMLDYNFGVYIGKTLEEYIPDYAYNAPDEFIRGLTSSFLTEKYIYSERLADGIITLLSMIDIYVNKETDNNIYRLKVEQKGTLLNDTVFSKIKSIEVVDTPTYVYDFTVDETKTFIIQGNLCCEDSFHSSGISKANLTGGLVRQNELLNASKRVKTPSCTFNLNKDMIDSTDLFKVKEFCNSNIRYYEIQDMLKDIEIDHNPTIDEKDEKYYSFFADTFDDTFRECEWRVKLLLNKDTLYKIKKDLMYITCCIYSCIDEVRQYLSIIFFPDDTGRIDIWIKHENILDPEVFIASSKKKKIDVNEEHKDIINSIINYNNKVLKFIKHILIPTINFVPISGIFGIEDCYYTEEKGGEWRIDTKGSNYKELILQPYVDFKRCKSNNMWDNFEVLGIEGAHRYLLEEFSEIIKVNKRHLDILIDSMTNPGKIMSVSRYGIDRKQVGPLAKACFEQPIENFLISASKGEIDDISGVTASITLGKLSRVGTGSMDLIVDTKKMMLTPNVYGEGDYTKEVKEMIVEELNKEDDDFEDMDIVGEEEEDFTY